MKTFYAEAMPRLTPEFFHFGSDGKVYMVIAPPGGGMAEVEIDIRLVSFIAAKAIRNKTGRAGEGGGMVKAKRMPKGD